MLRLVHVPRQRPPSGIAKQPHSRPSVPKPSDALSKRSVRARSGDGVSSTPCAKLYIDALNWSGRFFHGPDHWRAVLGAAANVKRFVKAARQSGVREMVAFIDAGTVTEEADLKWRQRRRAEVKGAFRRMPQALSVLLADAFMEAGVSVRYSVDADLDDTLAAHAQAEGACVLSIDRDFFRYTNSTFPLYNDYELRGGSLVLTKAQLGETHKLPRALLLDPLPSTSSKDPALVRLTQGQRVYLRGVPSPLVRLRGNPHAVVAPLRAALYAHLGLAPEDVVKESYPVWDEVQAKVVFVQKVVTPNPSLLNILTGDPRSAVRTFFPEEASFRSGMRIVPGCTPRDWSNHVYAVHAVVYELHCLATGARLLPLLVAEGRARGVGRRW